MSNAQDFFDQLTIFSERYVRVVGLQLSISVWGYDGWIGGKPKGAILHYTADEDFHRTLRWFLREKYQSQSSSNVVVADCKMPKHDECAEGLPLIQKLPVTVVQCRKHNTPSWHATWTNRMTYGVEIISAGELRSEQGAFFTWRPRDKSAADWTTPWEPRVDKTPTPLYGRWWAPYMSGQLAAVVTLLRHVNAIYGSFQKPWVLGHEAVQGIHTKRAKNRDKRDPGPTFPIHGIRYSVFNDAALDQEEWFQNFEADILNGQVWRDGALIDWARWKAEDLSVNPEPKVANARFQSHLDSWTRDTLFGVTGKTALYLLGYHMTRRLDSDLDTDEIQAIKIFQRMMGLKDDGQPGEKTRAAIVDRLVDRAILP